MPTFVDTFTELKTALEDSSNSETYFYVRQDINGVVGGIKIPNTKTDITIDGSSDGINRILYTDYGNESTGIGAYANTIRIDSPVSGTNYNVVVQNMLITGNNYYGVLYTDGAASANISYTLRNVEYEGPQPLHGPYSQVEMDNCNISVTTQRVSTAQEIAQCNRAVLAGKTTIKHQPSGTFHIFNLTNNTDTRGVTIKEGAEITITTSQNFTSGTYTNFTMEVNSKLTANIGGYFVAGSNSSITINDNTSLHATMDGAFFTGTPVALTLGESSSFELIGPKGFSNSATDRFGPISIGKNADLKYTQTERNGLVSTMYCAGNFTVEEGASVYLKAAYTTTPNELLEFYGAGCTLSLNKPRRFVLKNTSNSNSLISFSASNRLEITSNQINLWNRSETSGGFNSLPDSTWHRIEELADPLTFEPDVFIKGSISNTTFSLDTDGTNLEAAEQSALSPLSQLLPRSAYVFAVGELPFFVNPIAVDGWPVFGTSEPEAEILVEYQVEGTDYQNSGLTDENGDFSIPTDLELPLDTTVTIQAYHLYLYALKRSTVVPVGELVLEEAPTKITFDPIAVRSTPTVICKRHDPNIQLKVSDSRARSSYWKLSAVSENLLTGSAGHTLSDALVFCKEDSISILGSTATPIYTGPPNNGKTLETIISWPETDGILLQLTTTPLYNGEQYSGDLNWQLEETRAPDGTE